MAYMDQERKKELTPGIKAVLDKYEVKGSLSVNNHSSLVCKLTSGRIDFNADAVRNEYNQEQDLHRGGTSVNKHWIDRHWSGRAAQFLLELSEAMNVGNHDNSDIMTDYFDVGWYTDIIIGDWHKPYQVQ